MVETARIALITVVRSQYFCPLTFSFRVCASMKELLTSQCLDFLDVTSLLLDVVLNTKERVTSLCFTDLPQFDLATRPLMLLGCGDTSISAINTIDSATALQRSREVCKP
jgi:hypothetical protein